MKLEHAAAYLPYKVKTWGRYGYPYEIKIKTLVCGLNGFNFHDTEEPIWDLFIPGREQPKLILRPLTDLTKEIEINGEKFVPIEKIWKDCESASNTFDYKELLVEEVNLENILQYPYEIIVKLLSWHFDIFNLIEKSEAIDINTIA